MTRLELYHFTDFWNLENAGPDAILKAGLKAQDPRKHFPWMQPRPVVWLTAEYLWEKAAFWKRAPECRIVVHLPQHTKLLVPFPVLMERSGFEMDDSSPEAQGYPLPPSVAMRSCWVYYGDIPLARISRIEHATPDGKEPNELRAASGQGEE